MTLISIIGNGVVGSATALAFRSAAEEVRIYDIDPERSEVPLESALAADIIFLCLPTPRWNDHLDTTALDRFLLACHISEVKKFLVIRSTVPIGYTQAAQDKLPGLDLCHFPEFLTARTAKEDACNPRRLLIGTTRRSGGRPLAALCQELWPSVPLFWMPSNHTEFVKLLQNAFSAVKVSFFNEAKSLADAKRLDWELCLKALLAGGWVNPMHTQVPGPDGKYGFGGTCLPKDLGQFTAEQIAEDLIPSLCLAALARNSKDRYK